MKIAKPVVFSAAAVAVMLGVSVWAWPHMPPIVPVHFGIDGSPDRMGSRAEALLTLPVVAAGICLVFGVLPAIMPRNSRLERSGRAYGVTWLATVCVLLVLHVAMTLRAMGADVDVAKVSVGAVGLLFAVIGNFFGKVRYNYAMGIRTPWTLASEAVWDRTHRAAAPWVMVGGVALFLAAVVAALTGLPDSLLFGAIIVLGVAPIVGAAVYSYVVYRRLEHGRPDAGS